MMHGIEIDPAVLAMIQPGAKVRHWFGYQTPNPTSEIWHIRAMTVTAMLASMLKVNKTIRIMMIILI